MKKLLLILLTVSVLMSSVCMTAMAADTVSENGTKDVNITYNASENGGVDEATWTVTVPASLTTGQTGNVSVSGRWAPYEILSVTTADDMKLYLKGEKDYATVPVTYNDISLSGNYENTISKTETIVVDEDNSLSSLKFGTWEGILTFNIAVAEDPDYDYSTIMGHETDTNWYTENPEETNYNITTVDELIGLSAIVNGTAENVAVDDFSGKTITLEQDVDLSDVKWAAIGSYSTGKYFNGTLDGNGHTISGLNVGDGSANDQGFIGASSKDVVIKNITFDDATVNTKLRGAVVLAHAPSGTVTLDNITIKGDVKINGLSQVATIVGSGGNASFTASNITISVDEGSYVSNEGNTNQWDYVGGAFGQVWGSSFTDITSNIDLIAQFGRGVGGVLAGAGGTVKNVTCTGDITVLTKDTTVSHTNTVENGNAYGEIQRWQQTGLISGHRIGATTFINCTAAGTLTYADDNTHTNGMYFYNTNGEKCEDNRFGAARNGSSDNNITIND